MPKTKPLWAVITDGDHARIVVLDLPSGSFRTLYTEESINAHKQAADLGRDEPPRVFDRFGTGRHAIEPKTDPREKSEQKFLRAVAEQVNEIAAEDQLGKLVLVAPPKAMPILRDSLARHAAAKLAGTLVKDLVKTPNEELPRHLEEWLPPAIRQRL
jgi:protein required for attachment to host cells